MKYADSVLHSKTPFCQRKDRNVCTKINGFGCCITTERVVALTSGPRSYNIDIKEAVHWIQVFKSSSFRIKSLSLVQEIMLSE